MLQQIKNTTIILVILAGLFSFSYSKDLNNVNLEKRAIKSYVDGIQSDNDGLRKSSIFYAGIYRIHDAKQVLVERFDKAKDVNEKILIALSLYFMDEPEAFKQIKSKTLQDKELKGNNLTYELYEQFAPKEQK